MYYLFKSMQFSTIQVHLFISLPLQHSEKDSEAEAAALSALNKIAMLKGDERERAK